MPRLLILSLLSVTMSVAACSKPAPDVTSTIIINAQIHNGSGGDPFHGAVRIGGDRIVEIGEFEALEGEEP